MRKETVLPSITLALSVSVLAALGTAEPQPQSLSPHIAEAGIYFKKDGKWTVVPPEIANWKTGGVIKSHATLGVVKGDINGHINAPHSHTAVGSPQGFVIVCPEGSWITEYQLLRLRRRKSGREFRTVTGGVFHVSSGATRDVVAYESTQVGPRAFFVNARVEPGEYGFLPPGAVLSRNAALSTGSVYTFRVVTGGLSETVNDAELAAVFGAGDRGEPGERDRAKPTTEKIPPAAAPPSDLATVLIQSRPSEAEIYVDGDFVGNTPTTVHLAPGRHVVVIESPGFKKWLRTLNATPWANATIEAILEKAP